MLQGVGIVLEGEIRAAGRPARQAVRTAVGGLATAAVVAALVLVGIRGGYPAAQPRLLSGSAWLTSSQVGQVTLLDGSSAEVAAQVQVAARGERLDVVQRGADAYVVNRSAGSIRRVDGATFTPSPPATPIPDARGGLQAFAGEETLYALDTQRGVLVSADARTMTNRGPPVSLAAQVSPQAVALDDAGRLWVLDTATGDLIWIDGGRRHARRNAVDSGGVTLVLVGGAPVVVDPQRETATVLDTGSGAPRRAIGLDLQPGERVQVSGSAHADRLYVVASRGILATCDLSATECDRVIPLGSPGADLGIPVETGGRVFVPDYSTGQVWIVDLAEARVIARPKILSPATRFQLLTRDGVVFFNDPDSEHAGVIRLDGGVQPIAKYDPKNPEKGLSHPGPGGPPPPADPTTPADPEPPANPAEPARAAVGVRIVLSKPRAVVGEDITLKAVATTGTGLTHARWNFGDGRSAEGLLATHQWAAAGTYQVSVSATFADGQRGAASVHITVTATAPPTGRLTVTVAGGGTVTSQPAGISCPPACSAAFATVDRVTLVAAAAAGSNFTGWSGACTGPDVTCRLTVAVTGAQVSASFTAKPRLTVSASAGGTVTGGGIACPPTCRVVVDPGQSVTLTATPKQYYTFGAWGGACSGTALTCTVVVNANQTVSATFRDTAAPEDCVSHDPTRLEIRQVGPQAFQLVDSGTHLMATLVSMQDAQNALSVARGYTQHCFVGRGTRWIMEYWKGGTGRAGPVSPEDCIAYNPGNLTIVEVNDSLGRWWSLRDGSMWMEAFTSLDRAVRGLRVAQRYTRQCFIGRPDAELEYWR